MSLGPLMIDLRGKTIAADEREWLQSPLVGGVILFTRNFESVEQLARLVAEIHAARQPPLLVTVDQEGGRVQRFREPFFRLPPFRTLGTEPAVQMANQLGLVLSRLDSKPR